jgi:parallel beta-helix repeat protein
MHQDGMNKILQVAVLSLLLVTPCTALLFTPVRADPPVTLYVGQGEAYTTIQSALDNATDGYRIFVYNGTYREHLTITHRIDLFGEDRAITFIDGTNTTTVITITAPHVNLSHFTIQHAGLNTTNSLVDIQADSCIITDNILRYGNTAITLNHTGTHLIYDNIITHIRGDGLYLNDSNTNQNISYNTITDCRNGILSTHSDANHYYHNTLTFNHHNGLFLNDSLTSNTIHANTCTHNNHSGIQINDFTNYTTISDNTLSNNNDNGLALENCSQTTISTNTITTNINYGAKIIGSHNTLQDNTITDNHKDGIYLSADDNNTITHNTITQNHNAGLRLYNSTQDWITANTITYNQQYGAYLDFFTTHNLLYNNNFHNNTINACDKSQQQNHWNITTILATNIIGGNHTSGNYYDTYDQTSEGATDTNHDSLADTPYTIYADTKDQGPLLDTTPPTITNTHITPHNQTLGGTTTITTTVTDNTLVTTVTLTIHTPTQTLTIPITNNRTNTTYTCTRRYLLVGNYTATITATDPRNTNTTTNTTFSITPGTPPTLKDQSPKNATPNTLYTFTTNVTSTSASAQAITVYAIWTHNTKHTNTTLTHTTGNTFTATVLLDHSTKNLTYYFYTRDTWGNALTTTNKTVTVKDTKKPHILITRYGPSYTDLPGSYTYTATITDDSTIHNATIEYWTLGQPHRKTPMDHPTNDTYTKTIVPQPSTDRLYCIINATDEAGNTNNTKTPTAKPQGPVRALTNQLLTFNGTASYDLDGNITTYNWTFGDGTNATGATTQHTYDANGTYTVTLKVTDNDRRNGTNTTTISVGTFGVHTIPTRGLASLNTHYNLSLTTPFYCYDANGDSRIDSFYDPNDILVAVHDTAANVSGTPYFLLSTANDSIPEVLWNTSNDALIPVNHTTATTVSSDVDDARQQAVVILNVEKAAWIYLDTEDTYPIANLTITAENRTIPSSLIWREDGRVHVLDDASTEYRLTFTDIYPPLQVSFAPADGGIINEYVPTISMTFNLPVVVIAATFADADITSSVVQLDEMHFVYTPPAYLANGTYELTVDAQALHGTGNVSKNVVYIYFAYGAAPQKSFLEKNGLLLFIGLMMGGLAVGLFLLRWKGVTIDGSVYFQTRKIFPFFKTVVVGPMSVRIEDEGLQKAEFYVDGALKETATSFPYTWQWQEKALFKHTLETKVYDSQGNSASTGPVDIYFFNPYTRFREHD